MRRKRSSDSTDVAVSVPEEPVRAPSAGFPRGTILLIGLAAATVTAIGIGGIKGILAPVLLTLILSICAHPVRTGLEKRGVPHGLATGSVILVVFLLLAGFAYTLIIAFAQFVDMLPQYSDQFAEIGKTIGAWLQSIGISQKQVETVESSFDPSSIVNFFSGLLGSVFSITGALVIILTMLILMSADAVYVPTILRQLRPSRPDLVRALTGYATNVRRYMVVTTVLGAVQGVLNTIALVILGVPAALLWGLLAFLCSFIPNVGYFFALIPPIIFGFLVGGWPTVVAVIVVYGIINAVVQSIIQPRVVGNAVALSQTLTFFSVLFWAVIIGPIGAILAIPLTLMGRMVLIDANPSAQWISPAIGATAETRTIMKSDDAAKKQERQAKRGAHGASPPGDPEPDGE